MKPTTPRPFSRFQALDVSLELIRSLRGILSCLHRHDAALAGQLGRAASSISLNLAEGNRRKGGDRMHHFRIAAGSADESRSALLVATAWGFLDKSQTDEPLALLDRILAMTWRLTH